MNEEEIRDAFDEGELEYIYAIEELQELGYTGRQAEDIVESWKPSHD